MNHSSTSLVFLDASKFTPMAKSIPKVKDNVKTVVFWGEAKGGEAAAIEKQVLRPLVANFAVVMTAIHTLETGNRPSCQICGIRLLNRRVEEYLRSVAPN